MFALDSAADNFSSPQLPKGRGARLSYIADSRDLGHSKLQSEGYGNVGFSNSPGFMSSSGFTRENIHTSTPSSNNDAILHLTEMVGQLGAQIGESIVAKLMSSGVMNTTSTHPITPTAQTVNSEATRHDQPRVTVHVKSDRELPTFRGDNNDKYSVQDWIDMTKTHMRRHEIPMQDQSEEIIGHLLGKARDVVKIALRSDSTLDVTRKPELIYDVLLQYFSDAPSCLPLADFYATLPKHKENPVDYWIRLNKAADLALEGLRRQGKHTGNITDEVVLMFVKHCPDPELSCVLKCKPLNEWTSRDVQQRIDDYQRELRASTRVTVATQFKNHVTTVAPEKPSISSENLTDHTNGNSLSPSSFVHHSVSHPTYLPPASGQSEVLHPSSHSLGPVVVQHVQQSEERLLTRMVDIFQGMMEKMQQRNASHSTRGRQFQRTEYGRRPREAVCKVCNDSSHTTISHCMSERLCFACLAPGHTRVNCPASTPAHPQSEGN